MRLATGRYQQIELLQVDTLFSASWSPQGAESLVGVGWCDSQLVMARTKLVKEYRDTHIDQAI